MGWAVWLGVPVVATLLAAAWTWLRSRPAPPLTTTEAMHAHGVYLDALVETARSKDRGPYAPSAHD
jgi:hypothetical protein